MIAQKGKTLPYDIATHPPEARPLGTPATNPTLAQGVRTGGGALKNYAMLDFRVSQGCWLVVG